jgi:hypothetical protein
MQQQWSFAMLPNAQIKSVDPAVKLSSGYTTSTNGARNGGNGHHHRVRHQIRHNRRHAFLKAEAAVLLVERCGMPATKAVMLLGVSYNYYAAVKLLRASDDAALYKAVRRGDVSVLGAARRVKNAAGAIAAFKKCSAPDRELFRLATGATDDPITMLRNLTPDQLVTASKALGLDWVWNNMIDPAMETIETTTVEVLEAAE